MLPELLILKLEEIQVQIHKNLIEYLKEEINFFNMSIKYLRDKYVEDVRIPPAEGQYSGVPSLDILVSFFVVLAFKTLMYKEEVCVSNDNNFVSNILDSIIFYLLEI